MCTTSMYWALKGFCSREHSSQRHTNSFFSPWMCSLLMCCTHTITHIYNHKHTITHTQSHTFTITNTQSHTHNHTHLQSQTHNHKHIITHTHTGRIHPLQF